MQQITLNGIQQGRDPPWVKLTSKRKTGRNRTRQYVQNVQKDTSNFIAKKYQRKNVSRETKTAQK